MQPAEELLKQSADSGLVDQIMAYASTKEESGEVIMRKDFKDEKSRIYVTGYIGPVVLYVYL